MFVNEKINNKRQIELDLAKGLAVLFMIFIHSQLLFANENVIDSLFGEFNDFVGMVPSAPMFMFLLGVGINYTRKSDPKAFLKKGIMLILTGYLLNFLKGFLPNIIQGYTYSDSEYYYYGILGLVSIDILHFSGLAMIMFGLFKKYNLKISTIIILQVIISILNIYLLDVEVNNFALSSILGLLWGTEHFSYFPFLTWSFYPIAGYIFGSYLIRCTNKNKFYTICLISSLIVFLVGTYIFNVYFELANGMLSDDGYYHHIFTDNITFTALVILEISLLSFVVNILPDFVKKIIFRWSKNVTYIFFIHWIILSWLVLLIDENSLSMIPFVILLIFVILSSDYLSYMYDKFKKSKS